tara:strand:+ start:498 stop:968 length:471 start_codon:yes stop_codon:yes gene_type:complete
VSATMVICGVILTNSIEQIGMSNNPIGRALGMLLFVIGWVYIAYVFSINKNNKLLLFVLPSLGVVVSVMMMKKYMEQGVEIPSSLPMLFVVSWIVFGYATGNHLLGYKKYIGIIASCMVISSMMKLLPYKREMNMVDGLPMFVMTWVIFILLNSNR